MDHEVVRDLSSSMEIYEHFDYMYSLEFKLEPPQAPRFDALYRP